MLFKKELPINIINTHTSDDSRIILVNCKLNDNSYTILNIYAPDFYQDRKSFFKKHKSGSHNFHLMMLK